MLDPFRPARARPERAGPGDGPTGAAAVTVVADSTRSAAAELLGLVRQHPLRRSLETVGYAHRCVNLIAAATPAICEY
jgi:hypothetical protein